jgi:iron complex outermembrane recepter protein
LKPETLTSYETGYRGNWLNHQLMVDADLFYTTVDNKDESNFSTDPVPNLAFDNLNTAIARGAEMQLKYRFSPQRSVYLNYTYEHVTDTFDNEGEVTKNTPAHVVNLGAMADLGNGFSGSFNLGYKDSYFISFQQFSLAAAAYWRLDARLAYALPWYKDAEVYIAGQNLAASTHQEYADNLMIPRTYQGGVSVKFGGRG